MNQFLKKLALATLICLSSDAIAQPANADTPIDDQASLARAARIMKKIDKNKNGTFEKSEDEAAWKRYRRLDSNRDQVISIGELRQERSEYLQTGAERKLEIVYKTVGVRKLALDLYYPTNGDKAADTFHPVIFYTHGGGWAAGSKQGIARSSFSSVFLPLLNQGFAVASVSYRLCKKDSGVTMRDCVIDCKDAVRYLAKNKTSLKLDPQKFFVMGDSAGGHIAQMLLLTDPETLPGDKSLASAQYRMAAGVSWYGPCDFEKTELFNHDDRTDFRDRFSARILGTNTAPADKLKRYREISPINYLKRDSPPLLMIQGDQDTTIPVKHAHYMKRKATEINANVEIMIIRNAGHNWRKVNTDIQPSRQEIVMRTIQFIDEHRQNLQATTDLK